MGEGLRVWSGSASAPEVRREDTRSSSGALPVTLRSVRMPWGGAISICVTGSSSTEPPAPRAEGAGEAVRMRRKTDAELISSLHERSGLTWETLAKVLGVSRRSLHMWAAGSTVTPAHRAVMDRFELLLNSFGPLPSSEVRARLFDRSAGTAPVDRFRMERDGGKSVINGPVLAAHQMM